MPAKKTITLEYQLLTSLMNCANKIGAHNTMHILNEAVHKRRVEDINFCVQTILSKMTVEMEDLRRYNYNDNRKVAIGFCVYFLCEVYDLKISILDKYFPFKLKLRMLSNYKNIIAKAKIDNPKTDIEKIVATHYSILNKIFVNHKNLVKNEKG